MADQGEHILPVHFFKIILRTNLQRIKLPLDFTDMYGNGWSNPVFINPPDGTEWEVYWSKENDEVWFEQGWKEFTENYSLEHGCMVVFKYEGASKFGAVILDKDTVEIEYASDDENGNLNKSDEESAQVSVSDDESDEFWNPDDELPDQSEQMREIDYPALDTCEENGNHDQSDDDDDDDDYDDDDDDEAFEFLGECPDLEQRRGGESSAQRTSSLNFPREARAKEIAQAFISNNPFITVCIKPCDMVNCTKTIHCLRGYVENKEKDVMLHVGERFWGVKMVCFDKPPILQRCFSAGWPLFAKEAKLQPGDVCIFELITREDPIAFKVHVYKHNGEKAGQMISVSLNMPKEGRAREVAKSFNSNYPFFTITIKPSAKHHQYVLSLKGFIELKNQNVMLHTGEGSWNVKMLCFHHRTWLRCKFSSGWSLFVRENELHLGDVCVFELINTEDPVAFKVHVFKDKS